MERCRIWKGGDTGREDTERMKPDGAGGWENLGTVTAWGGTYSGGMVLGYKELRTWGSRV